MITKWAKIFTKKGTFGEMSKLLRNILNPLTKINSILNDSEKRNLILLSIGSVILSVTEVFSIGIIVPIVILFSSAEKFQTGKAFKLLYQFTMARDLKEFFFILSTVAVILFIFKSAYNVFIYSKQQEIIGRIYTRLTARLMQDYLAKPYSFHLVNNSSLLFKNIAEEISRFTGSYLNPSITIMSESIIFIGVFSFLLFMYPLVTLLIVLIFGVVVTFLNILLIKRIGGYSIARERHCIQIFVTAAEALSAVKEIQMYDVNKYFTDKFSNATKGYTQALVKFNIVSNLPRPVLETFIFALFLIGMMVCVKLNKSFTDLIPMMTVVGIVCLRLLSSISKIYLNIHTVFYNANAADIVYDIILKSDLRKEEISAINVKDFNIVEKSPSICLKHITFSYQTATSPILEDFSLTIPLNQTIAIVGRTGSGKSTLIDILMGLLEPSKGLFSYRDSIITRNNITDYRKKIGYVPQNFFLTDDSICANIAFGVYVKDINYKKLEHAICVSQLGSFIKDLPEGINTQIGEKGIRISGGQRQRIGLARALYREPEILVLDEATSALDKHTEEDFYSAIKNMGRPLSIILVTHRLSTLEHTDHIFVMEDGKLAAQGSLRELLENSPVFQKMTNQKIISEARE